MDPREEGALLLDPSRGPFLQARPKIGQPALAAVFRRAENPRTPARIAMVQLQMQAPCSNPIHSRLQVSHANVRPARSLLINAKHPATPAASRCSRPPPPARPPQVGRDRLSATYAGKALHESDIGSIQTQRAVPSECPAFY